LLCYPSSGSLFFIAQSDIEQVQKAKSPFILR
jgi:hypothetical protein